MIYVHVLRACLVYSSEVFFLLVPSTEQVISVFE